MSAKRRVRRRRRRSQAQRKVRRRRTGDGPGGREGSAREEEEVEVLSREEKEEAWSAERRAWAARRVPARRGVGHGSGQLTWVHASRGRRGDELGQLGFQRGED